MTVESLYSNPDLVARYIAEEDLQPPETTILNELSDWLSGKTMLDIGVGGGRTTKHFSRLVDRYVGIDLSPQMITACLERFQSPDLRSSASSQGSIEFVVSDVRDMSMFENDTFDFVLFSYNGISHLTGADRTKALHEIHRVAKPSGYFCFSAHNLQYLDRAALGIRRHLPKNPRLLFRRKLIQKLARWAASRFLYNRHLYRADLNARKGAIMYYSRFGLRFGLCYIRPTEQLRQLEGLFTDIRVFSLNSADELDVAQVESAKDEWLYYLCTVT